MAVPPDVFFAPLTELNRRLRAREFSAADLARAFASRLERLGPRFNALALSLREQGVRKAKDVDDDLRRERFRGPLQGIPFGVKDLLAVAGKPTTWGAKPFASQVFDYDAAVVTRLNKAGAVLLGKLALVELAGGGGYRFPAASLQGPGLNPWGRERWSGGSSSGSAAAVAAGLLPFALGSETSGSILTPAAFCGVTGLRPTYGLVSRYGAMPLAWTMDKIGTFARTAEDCGHILRVIAGGDNRDPGSAGKSFFYTPEIVREWKLMKVGFAPVDFEETLSEPYRPVYRAALDVVRGLGMPFVETKLPDYPYGALAGTVIGAEGSSVFQDLIENGRIEELADQKQIAGLRAGLTIAAKDYLKAMRVRRLLQEDFRQIFAGVDVLVAPTRFSVASGIQEPLDRAPGTARPPAVRPGMRALIPAGNLAGLPALSVPCGFVDGMPVGLQLVGRPFSENVLLAVGRFYQQHTDWHTRRPDGPLMQ